MLNTDCIALVTGFGQILVGAASLAISWLVYKMGLPSLQFNMWFGYDFDLTTGQRTNKQGIFVQITNLSTRPITVTSIGGEFDNAMSKFYKKWIKREKIEHFFWDSMFLTLSQKGEPIFLEDSQTVKGVFPYTGPVDVYQGLSTALKIKRIWALDAAGNYYHLPRKAFKELINAMAGGN